MRNIVLIGVLCLLLIFRVGAEPANSDPDDLKSNVSLLASQCGYVLGDDILSEILRSSSKINDQIISFDFYVSMKPANRPIHGRLSFGCFVFESAVSKQGVAKRLTAGDEIIQSDSGGGTRETLSGSENMRERVGVELSLT